MVAVFVAAAIVTVIFVIVMQEGGLPAHRAGRVVPPARATNLPLPGLRPIRGKLVTALAAKIFLVSVRVFAVTIKG